MLRDPLAQFTHQGFHIALPRHVMVGQAQPLCQIAVIQEPLAQQALSATAVLEELDLRRHTNGCLQQSIVLQ